jgi:hypothetical protein
MQDLDRSRQIPSIVLLMVVLFFGLEVNAAQKTTLAERGEKLYTQFSLFYEKDHHITTNYRKGILVPVNTEVEFVKATKKRITVKIPSYNVTVDFENEEDYSGQKIEGIFKRTFARQPVDLAGFGEEERSEIKKGTVKAGMSKEAVIKAMGYPPQHKTPTLEMDQWRYWKNRFDTMLVSFENGKVSAIQD